MLKLFFGYGCCFVVIVNVNDDLDVNADVLLLLLMVIILILLAVAVVGGEIDEVVIVGVKGVGVIVDVVILVFCYR